MSSATTGEAQSDLKVLDDKLSREFREPPMSEILSVLATHNVSSTVRWRRYAMPLIVQLTRAIIARDRGSCRFWESVFPYVAIPCNLDVSCMKG